MIARRMGRHHEEIPESTALLRFTLAIYRVREIVQMKSLWLLKLPKRRKVYFIRRSNSLWPGSLPLVDAIMIMPLSNTSCACTISLAGYDEMLLEAECFAQPLDGRSQESRPDVCSSATTALRF
jgi:hypothetical protein